MKASLLLLLLVISFSLSSAYHLRGSVGSALTVDVVHTPSISDSLSSEETAKDSLPAQRRRLRGSSSVGNEEEILDDDAQRSLKVIKKRLRGSADNNSNNNNNNEENASDNNLNMMDSVFSSVTETMSIWKIFREFFEDGQTETAQGKNSNHRETVEERGEERISTHVEDMDLPMPISLLSSSEEEELERYTETHSEALSSQGYAMMSNVSLSFVSNAHRVQCGADGDGSDCRQCHIPQEKCNPDHVACTMEYDPVCGCDHRTHSNACMARYYGCVRRWTRGQCQDKD